MTPEQRETFELQATALGHDLVAWFQSEAAADLQPWQASDDKAMGTALLELLGRLGIEVAVSSNGAVLGSVVHRPFPWERAFYSVPCLTALLADLRVPLLAALTPCRCARCDRVTVPLPGMACDACHVET